MRNKLLKVVTFIIMVIIAVVHFYYFTHLYSHDEIWIFGFGANITEGLVPYRDFNMVITPFFPYLLSVILSILGKKLIVYHVVIAVMITVITFLAFRKIKFYSLLIYVALLIFSLNGYNTSTLLWLFLLLMIVDENNKYKDVLIPIVIGIMILTKQTMVLLVIPSIIYSKDIKKSLAVYLVIVLSFFVYLVSHNNLMQFLDYCLFGMFDFADKNSSSSFFILVIQFFVCMILLLILIRSRGKREDVFYVLLYQIMSVPILEIYHFVLGWSAFLYVLFSDKKLSDVIKNSLFTFLIVVEFSFAFTTNELFTIRDLQYFEHYPKKESFMEGRMITNNTKDYVDKMSEFILDYSEYELYIFGNYSYIVKVELGIPINKFDLINNGNMGYKGAIKYIEEIEGNCSNKKCLFIIDDNELNREDYTQVNRDILMYVINNTSKIYSSNIFGVYIN